MLTKLKQKVQKTLAKTAETAHKLRLTPNKISMVGAVFALASAIAYGEWQTDKIYLLLATVLLLFSGFCDALDGVVARQYQQATVFGGFLDSLLDRYADATIYIGIIISGLCEIKWGLAALIGSLLVSYSRARAEAANVKIESVGLAERAERILILAIASTIAFFYEPYLVMNYSIILLAVLTNLTVLQRVWHTYKKLKEKKL